MTAESADPIVNNLNRPFWEGAAEGRIVLPHCIATEQAFWPPSPISPFEGGRHIVWQEIAPTGRIVARVIYRRAFQKAFADHLPYGIAMVALDCGPRLQVHVTRPDAPAAPVVGDAVTLSFETLLPAGLPLLVAHPITD